MGERGKFILPFAGFNLLGQVLIFDGFDYTSIALIY